MDMNLDTTSPLYRQDTELQILALLHPWLHFDYFLDVGAEKGTFARELFRMGFTRGALFEPLPSHVKHLKSVFAESCAKVLPYAVDFEDRIATFNIACDAAGEELKYFHSLNRIADHAFFKHSRSIDVQCRSLSSLLGRGEIHANVGVLKIDTEGNDLRVLQGLGDMRPEVVMCEFVPPAVYPDWPLSFAAKLIPEAAKLGYNHFVAVQRTHGNTREAVRIDPQSFTENDWGNLIFIHQDLWRASEPELKTWLHSYDNRFSYSAEVLVRHHSRYGASFQDWLLCQLEGFRRAASQSMALDVGAYEGDFFKSFFATDLVSSAVLFEPNPHNATLLRQKFHGSRIAIEEMAVAAESGSMDFHYGDDPATGSLLKPVGWTTPATQHVQVATTSLDDYATRHGLLDKINALKIDTQGSDLQVLRGSEVLLRESQPIIVVEMIFAPLYENQDEPSELMHWMAQKGYRLAGLFDEHYSREGWLAWCDACFLPVSRLSPYLAPFTIRQTQIEAAISEPHSGGQGGALLRPDKRRKSVFQKMLACLSGRHN